MPGREAGVAEHHVLRVLKADHDSGPQTAAGVWRLNTECGECQSSVKQGCWHLYKREGGTQASTPFRLP